MDNRTDRVQRIGEARVRLWSSRTGKEVHRLLMADDVDAVAFSPDGARLAARTAKGVVVYAVRDWSEAARFEFSGKGSGAGSVRFASSDRVVAEAAGGVQVWPLDGTKGVLLRHGSDWPFYRVSDDGSILATISRTRMRVWDVAAGTSLFEMDFPEGTYRAMAFVGPDDALVARTKDGLERVLWRSDNLIAEACRRFDRDITADEWSRYVKPGPPSEVCPETSRSK